MNLYVNSFCVASIFMISRGICNYIIDHESPNSFLRLSRWFPYFHFLYKDIMCEGGLVFIYVYAALKFLK